MTRLYVWWFDGLWRHTVCHNPTTANLLDRMLQATPPKSSKEHHE